MKKLYSQNDKGDYGEYNMDFYEEYLKRKNKDNPYGDFGDLFGGSGYDDLFNNIFNPKEPKKEEPPKPQQPKLNRVLTIGGPFDKKSHFIPPHKELTLIRIDLTTTTHSLYRRIGKNDKGEGVYEYVRDNQNEE